MNILSLGMNILGKLKYAPNFEKDTKDPKATQEKLLLDFVEESKHTAYGRKHNFHEIKSVADYQKNVPINKYLDLLPYIEKIKKGEENILTSEMPVLFALTSGTTGKPKFIPLTPTFIRKYQDAVQTWFYFLIKDHPRYFDGKIFMPGSPLPDRKTSGGIPIGTISGYILDHMPSFMRKKYAFSNEDIVEIEDYQAKYYVMMRLAMEQDISAFGMANPATLILLAQKGDEYKQEIIKDIRNGTLNGKFKIPNSCRRRIETKLSPNPARALELEKIVEKKGYLYPKDYWHNMSCIGLWKGGSLSAYVPQLEKYMGPVPVREAGFSGTEGRYATPISDEGAYGALTVSTMFYEFIPEDDRYKKNPHVLLVDQLKINENYHLVITTHSGLYRYDLNDVVRVVGWHNKTPLIEFLHKGEGFSNIIGEKVSEWQILRSLRLARKETGLPYENALVKPKPGELPCYLMFASFNGKITKSDQKRFLQAFDKSLQKLNMEYKKRRDSLRLDMPKLFKVDGDKLNEQYHNHKLSHGAYEAQIKSPCLITDYNHKDFRNIEEDIL